MKFGLASTFESYRSVLVGKKLRVKIAEKGVSWDDLGADTMIKSIDCSATLRSPKSRLDYRKRIVELMDEVRKSTSSKVLINFPQSSSEEGACSMLASVVLHSLVEWATFNHDSAPLDILLETFGRSSEEAFEREFCKWLRASDVYKLWVSMQESLYPAAHVQKHQHIPINMWWHKDEKNNETPFHYRQIIEIEQTFLHSKGYDMFLLTNHAEGSATCDDDSFHQVIYKDDDTEQYMHTTVFSLECLPVLFEPFDPSKHDMPGYSAHMAAFSVLLEGRDRRGCEESKQIVDNSVQSASSQQTARSPIH
eukprot:gene29660-35803_t